jgi:hypothetical protein
VKYESEMLWKSNDEFAKVGRNLDRVLAIREADDAVLEVIE